MVADKSSASNKQISVLIVDDHPLIRDGLRGYFETISDIQVVGECSRGEEVAEAVATLRPRVVLMDLMLRGSQVSGIEAIYATHQARPEAKVLALSAYVDEKLVLTAIRASVAGYLLKNAPQTQIVDGIRTVANGQKIFDPEVMRIVETALGGAQPDSWAGQGDQPQPGKLTTREWEVVELIAQNCSNEEIADRLVIDIATVKTHVSHILGKLGVEDRRAAALWFNLHHDER